MKVPIEDRDAERAGVGAEADPEAEATEQEATQSGAQAECSDTSADETSAVDAVSPSDKVVSEDGDNTSSQVGTEIAEEVDRDSLDTPDEQTEAWDEEAMVAAARAAGEAAAEADLRAEAERAAATSQTDVDEQEPSEEGVWTDEDDAQVAAEVALRAELETAHAEATEATARLARLQADWENYRRRTAAERLAERERAAEGLVTALLPVLDDMERASSHAAGSADIEKDSAFGQFVAGVDAVHDKMVGVLEREGVEVIDPAGQAFDPLEHQAVGRVENADVFADTIAEVYQRGYRMGGKVIRSAMVTVTYGGPTRPTEASDEGDDQ